MAVDDREKLVELANDVLRYLPWGEIQKDTAEQIADRMMDHGVTVREWIPVMEMLPKEDEDVITLCYWHESWQVQVCHRSSNWPGHWYTSIAGQWVPSVSHWMPLPQTPKGE